MTRGARPTTRRAPVGRGTALAAQRARALRAALGDLERHPPGPRRQQRCDSSWACHPAQARRVSSGPLRRTSSVALSRCAGTRRCAPSGPLRTRRPCPAHLSRAGRDSRRRTARARPGAAAPDRCCCAADLVVDVVDSRARPSAGRGTPAARRRRGRLVDDRRQRRRGLAKDPPAHIDWARVGRTTPAALSSASVHAGSSARAQHRIRVRTLRRRSSAPQVPPRAPRRRARRAGRREAHPRRP